MLLHPSFSIRKENAVAATLLFIRKLKVPVTATTVIETLQGHPDYPSLLSVSDSLHQWQIDNICLKAGPEKLDELPVPFIAHLRAGRGSFAVVTSIMENEITYIDTESEKKPITKSREDFLKAWSGVVLLAEAGEQSGEKDHSKNKKKEWLQQSVLPFMLIASLILIASRGSSVSPALFIATILLPAIKLAGCIVTGLLLWYEIDQQNELLKNICSGGKKTNCQTVLQSKQAKLFNWVSWSEIGFFYFMGSFLFMLFNPGITAISLVAWLNIIALPYTAFSVYYQWRVAKQWCVLCLTVQAMLLIEFAIFYFSFWGQSVQHAPITDGHLFVNFLAAMLLPIFFWSFTKTFFIKAQTGEANKRELTRLKHNTQIFDALLEKQKAIDHDPSGLGIILGNPAAHDTLIKVCNPYCGPCARAHASIEELLKQNENLKVQIIFTATNDEKDIRAKPVRHFMALAERNKQLMQQALDDWYLAPEKNYEKFSEKYPMNGELGQQDKKLQEMSQWCTETEVFATPTFFFNGHKLPDVYTVNDLKYFLAT